MDLRIENPLSHWRLALISHYLHWENRLALPFSAPGARFPGQYYDAESGLHYNTFRDYDPATGRYIESDPIGLEGGVNTYAYVGGNPLSSSDSWGLAASICVRNPTALGCGPLEGGFGGGMSRGGTATAGPDPVGFFLKLIGSVVGALAGSDACGGGDSSYDKPACNDDPYDKCRKNQEGLEYVRKEILNILHDPNLLFYTQRIRRYNNAARTFNREIEKHNTACPHNKISLLPILNTLDGGNM